jgi:hypothetical protein
MSRLVAILLMLAATAAWAEPRKYAVLSLIGDQMLVVQYVPMIGSRIDKNTRDYLELTDPVVDKAALLAASNAIKKVDPDAKPVLLLGTDRRIYSTQARLLDSGRRTDALIDLVRPLVKGANATHLILVSKDRGEARMQLYDATVGSGMIEGVGFYVDPVTSTKLEETGQSATGFVGAYAYFWVSLIDLATEKIVAEEKVNASRPQVVPNTRALDVWTGTTGADKMRTLRDVVVEEVGKSVGRVIAAPGK